MRILFFLLILFFFIELKAELLKPSADLLPEDVISIQLSALKENNNPYINAGIEQTWQFAHSMNRKFTGPLFNFTKMMYSPSYIIMLEHLDHNIIFVKDSDYIAYFFIELTDKKGNRFGFQWTLEKVINESEFKDCWMTIGVSQPMSLVNSI